MVAVTRIELDEGGADLESDLRHDARLERTESKHADGDIPFN